MVTDISTCNRTLFWRAWSCICCKTGF